MNEPDAAYCPGCGQSEYAGITHVCPPLDGTWRVTTEATRTVSTIPTYFNTGLGRVTTGGAASA